MSEDDIRERAANLLGNLKGESLDSMSARKLVEDAIRHAYEQGTLHEHYYDPMDE